VRIGTQARSYSADLRQTQTGDVLAEAWARQRSRESLQGADQGAAERELAQRLARRKPHRVLLGARRLRKRAGKQFKENWRRKILFLAIFFG